MIRHVARAALGRGGGPAGIFNGYNDVVETGDVSRWEYDPLRVR